MKANEKGITVVMLTTYDLSGKTALEVTIINPDATEQTVADGSISISGATYASQFGTAAANTYAMFDTTETMFDDAQIADGADNGTWQAYLKYTDATKVLYSDTVTITVDAVP